MKKKEKCPEVVPPTIEELIKELDVTKQKLHTAELALNDVLKQLAILEKKINNNQIDSTKEIEKLSKRVDANDHRIYEVSTKLTHHRHRLNAWGDLSSLGQSEEHMIDVPLRTVVG